MTYDELKALIDKRGVHTVFGDYGEGWFIEQSSWELAHFLVAMQVLGVSKVLEIGTGWRAGLARFLANDMGWRVVSVDKNQPVSLAPNVEFMQGTSEWLRPLFEGATFDLVIIDADHSYEAVKRDFELYAPLATKAIMFHDIAGLRDCEGVARYWAEVKASLPGAAHEIIAEGDQRGGIGWLNIAEISAPTMTTDEWVELEETDDLTAQVPEPTDFITAAVEDWAENYIERHVDLDAEIHAPAEIEELPEPAPAPEKRGRKPKAAK